MDAASVRKLASLAVMLIAGWTLVALFSTVRMALEAIYAGQELDWRGAWFRGAAHAYPWVFTTPAVLWVVRRFPLVRHKLLPRAVLHAVAGVLFAVANFGVYAMALAVVDARLAQQLTLLELQLNLLIYVALVGLGHAIDYAQRFREREVRNSRLEAQLTRARLDLLKTQLHPHFLFNTLNAIAELIHEDAMRAEQMIADLSELLRQALDASVSDTVALTLELELLERYLAIERTRFEGRLNVIVDVPDDVRCAMVPYLLLQPLVENAIKYSMKNRVGPGAVRIHAEVRGGDLLVEVVDNGPGFAAGRGRGRGRDRDIGGDGDGGGSTHAGIGLGNTRERLRQRYGEAQQLTVDAGPDGGARVSLRIPFERAGVLQ